MFKMTDLESTSFKISDRLDNKPKQNMVCLIKYN